MDIFKPDGSLPELEFEWVDKEHTPGQKTIFHLIKKVVKCNSSITAQDVARRIDELYPPNRSAEDQAKEEIEDSPEGYIWFIWETFHWFARRIPYNHPAQDRLASTVAALRGTVGKTQQLYIAEWNETYQLWQDLPMLAPNVREDIYSMFNFLDTIE